MATVESLVPKVAAYLATAARQRRIVTYGEVAQAVGTHARVVPMTLEVIRGLCIERGWPAMTSIVVSAETKKPGEAFLDPWVGRDTVAATKEQMTVTMQDAVFVFDWTPLLAVYGVTEVPVVAVEAGRGLTVKIPTRTVTFTRDQYERWVNNDRADCMDDYCRGMPGSAGFGEYIVGQHFAAQGYLWIHHDFNIFGGNRPGKYPKAEAILRRFLGDERYEAAGVLYPTFRPLEEPDLLIYKPDLSEVRFAESKRVDTKDKLREAQVKGLALISLLFGCPAEVFDVVEQGKAHVTQPVEWSF